jgi:hypothetical protein
MFADAMKTNFNFTGGEGTAAGSVGIVPLDVDDAGPNW